MDLDQDMDNMDNMPVEPSSSAAIKDDRASFKPASRKSHRKTRTGCKVCKQRKIKCDETRPQCNNCLKHSVRCDYHQKETSSEGGLNTGVQSRANTPLDAFDAGYNTTYASTTHGRDVVPTKNLDILDLELMHTYATTTAFTLHTDPAVKSLLQVEVPKLGLKHDFVMRGVLALAALHLARFKPDSRDFYLAQATYHQDIGLRAATKLLPNLDNDNSSAVYVFSSFTLFHALASPRKPGDLLIGKESGIADWLFLLKGSTYIMRNAYESLLAGPIGPIIKAGAHRDKLRQAHHASLAPVTHPIDDLWVLLQANVTNQEELKCYETALGQLRLTLVLVYYEGVRYEGGEIFTWLYNATEGFLELLKRQTQESLTLFAHFCVLLRHSEHHWWMEGWSEHLIARIYYVLDDHHRHWIRWPMSEIGWMPA